MEHDCLATVHLDRLGFVKQNIYQGPLPSLYLDLYLHPQTPSLQLYSTLRAAFTMLKQLLPLVGLLPGLLQAQVIPFTFDGALDSAQPDTDEYNTGGKISVNGVNVVVPKNLQFQFPAAWVGMKEIAANMDSLRGHEVTVCQLNTTERAIC